MNLANPEEVRRVLLRHGRIGPQEFPAVTPLDGGVSSEVVRVAVASGSLVIKRALPKLRVDADWYADVSRNQTEWMVMREIGAISPEEVPSIRFVDPEEGLFAMEYVTGRVWKAELLAGRTHPDVAARLGSFLGRLHRLSPASSPWLSGLDDKTLFQQLRLAPYFDPLPALHPDCAEALKAVRTSLLASSQTLVHGDFSPKNVLLRTDNTPVVLDWEVAHLGNPVFDLSFMLHHLYLKSLYAERPRPYWELADIFYRSYWSRRGGEEQSHREETLRTTGALMMARVDGKSPVDYLSPNRQQAALQVGSALLQGRFDDWPAVWEAIGTWR